MIAPVRWKSAIAPHGTGEIKRRPQLTHSDTQKSKGRAQQTSHIAGCGARARSLVWQQAVGYIPRPAMTPAVSFDHTLG